MEILAIVCFFRKNNPQEAIERIAKGYIYLMILSFFSFSTPFRNSLLVGCYSSVYLMKGSCRTKISD